MLQVLNHYARAIGRLANQFFNSPKLRGLVGVAGDQVQKVEDAFWAMGQAVRSVSVATGKTLERVGALVGTPARAGKTDTLYRARINTQIAANRSSGEGEAIYAMARAMIPEWSGDGDCKIVLEGNGCYEIRCEPAEATLNDKQDAIDLAVALGNSSAAGVRAIVISRSATPTFRFGSGATGPRGFGNGKLIGAYSFKG
jgi:hypothetical protein